MRIFYIIFSILTLASCTSNLKQKIGLETKGPNEYSVEKTTRLEVPPHYDLPAPSLNAAPKKNNKTIQNKTKVSDEERALISDLEI